MRFGRSFYPWKSWLKWNIWMISVRKNWHTPAVGMWGKAAATMESAVMRGVCAHMCWNGKWRHAFDGLTLRGYASALCKWTFFKLQDWCRLLPSVVTYPQLPCEIIATHYEMMGLWTNHDFLITLHFFVVASSLWHCGCVILVDFVTLCLIWMKYKIHLN